jgi:hypothetical protein
LVRRGAAARARETLICCVPRPDEGSPGSCSGDKPLQMALRVSRPSKRALIECQDGI